MRRRTVDTTIKEILVKVGDRVEEVSLFATNLIAIVVHDISIKTYVRYSPTSWLRRFLQLPLVS